ncbi:MAG TPA: hypothetical protein ENH42_00680 [Desulfobacteraceae bacterium]|nr:hypothetical protein [Desulfobacteraceae bacterium]
MSVEPRIIHDNKTLFESFEELSAGDIVIGRVRLRPGEEHLLLDLVARGVVLFPSATSQLCSRSKVFQARLLGRFMIPGTAPVYDMHDMMCLVSEYGKQGVERVVCKIDRANGGLGVLLYSSIEEVYSQAVLGVLRFPFVAQPFQEECCDVRVVMLGDTVDAYQRHNPHNFRHNLHCGGTGSPWVLSAEQAEFCHKVMARSGFPYAHIDLLLSPAGDFRLTEINLRGGLRGARICQDDYDRAVEKIHAALVAGQLQRHGRQGTTYLDP